MESVPESLEDKLIFMGESVTVTVYFPSSRIDHFTPLMILHSIQSNSAACSNSMNCNCPLI